MNCPIYIDRKKRVWLSYEYLIEHVSESTISQWSKRNVCDRIYIDGRAFVAYDTIPGTTRNKLPDAERLRVERDEWYHKSRFDRFNSEIQEAYTGINSAKWRNIIQEKYDFPVEKAIELGRKASVYECILNIRKDGCRWQGDLERLFSIFRGLYPDAYSQKSRFTTSLTKAKDEGVLSVVIDKRSLSGGRPEKYDDSHKGYAFYILSHNKGYSMPMAYDYFVEACKRDNMEAPAYRWFQGYYYANKQLIDQNRYGKTVWQKDCANYMKIIPALYVGDQWQMDGWRIPIYCKKRNEKGGTEYFVTYNLFAVMDAHSRRIIGYDIAESENTENILKGLENAVSTTGILPFEIVADNHSFNKTKEAGNLKEDTERLGVTWTIDSNPRRKAILERAFRTLGDKHFKKRYGYIGQGIKTKIKNGITQQELRDIYTKPENFLTEDQVKMVAISVINEYNNTLKPSLGDTPNNRYKVSKQPNAIAVDMFSRFTIFNRKSEHKVSHGQIRIKRGQHEYEYQLPAEYSVQYNGKQVGVRYADFDEIYLYDLDTNTPICTVSQKRGTHGALANQTEADKELLLKNSGRQKGINSKNQKRKENIFDKANTINPNAYDTLNVITTPKDDVQEVKQNQILRTEAQRLGVYVDTVAPLPIVDEMLDSSMKPRKKENKHPFAVESNEIKTIRI